MWSISTFMPRCFAGFLHSCGEIEHGELLGELVVDAAFALLGGIQAGELDAADGVANIQEAASLAAFAIDSERLADGCLHAEAV